MYYSRTTTFCMNAKFVVGTCHYVWLWERKTEQTPKVRPVFHVEMFMIISGDNNKYVCSQVFHTKNPWNMALEARETAILRRKRTHSSIKKDNCFLYKQWYNEKKHVFHEPKTTSEWISNKTFCWFSMF